MVDIVSYSNASSTTVRGNSYTVDGSTLTFALPIQALDNNKDYVVVTLANQFQIQGVDYTYPSAQSIGAMGIDFINGYPTSAVDIRVSANQTTEAGIVTLEEIKDYLTINSPTYDARLSNLNAYATGLIESYCSRKFVVTDFTYEYHSGGFPYIFINNPPIAELMSVAEYDGTEYIPLNAPPIGGGLPNTAANTTSAQFTYDSDSGRIWKGFMVGVSSNINNLQSFNAYSGGIRVAYRGGYTTIPNDIKLCCLALIKDLHKGMDAKVTQFDRERIEQQPYSAGFPPHIRRILDLYRLVV